MTVKRFLSAEYVSKIYPKLPTTVPFKVFKQKHYLGNKIWVAKAREAPKLTEERKEEIKEDEDHEKEDNLGEMKKMKGRGRTFLLYSSGRCR